MRAQVREAVGDPVDVLLDRQRHVATARRRAARARDREQVREAVDREAEVGARAVRPLVAQRAAAGAADVDVEERAVIASKPIANTITSTSYSASAVAIPRRRDPPRSARCGRRRARRCRGCTSRSSRCRRTCACMPMVVRRAEQLGHRRVAHDLADLLARELLRGDVRLRAREAVGELRRQRADAARRPAAPRRCGGAPRRSRRTPSASAGSPGTPGVRQLRRPASLGVVATTSRSSSGSSGRLHGRHRVVGRALEHVQALRLRARSAGCAWMPVEPVPTKPTRCPVKSTPSCGHSRRVEPSAAEVVEPRDVGPLDGRRGCRCAMMQNRAVTRSPRVGDDRPACSRRRRSARPSPRSGTRCRGAGRTGRRRAPGSGGSPAARRSARSTPTRRSSSSENEY